MCGKGDSVLTTKRAKSWRSVIIHERPSLRGGNAGQHHTRKGYMKASLEPQPYPPRLRNSSDAEVRGLVETAWTPSQHHPHPTMMPNPRRGWSKHHPMPIRPVSERTLWHPAAASMEQVLGEPAEFISLHRLVQGENIPPAHLMNEAAVLRRASSSFNSQTDWFKERISHLHNLWMEQLYLGEPVAHFIRREYSPLATCWSMVMHMHSLSMVMKTSCLPACMCM